MFIFGNPQHDTHVFLVCHGSCANPIEKQKLYRKIIMLGILGDKSVII